MSDLTSFLMQVSQNRAQVASALQFYAQNDPETLYRIADLLAEAERRLTKSRATASLSEFCTRFLPDFETPPHTAMMIDALERVEAGLCKRLIIAMPPRHGKTYTSSVAFVAWFLARNKRKEVMFATYNQELANQRGRSVRELIQMQEFKDIFPDVSVKGSSSAAQRFETSNNNQYFAVGVGGPLTGRGAHLAIIDDPIKNREEAESATEREKLKAWYQSAFRTRLYPGGAIIIIATRWHLDDLTGYVLSENMHENWEVLEFPAILDEPASKLLNKPVGTALWPERYDLKELKMLQRSVGSREWTALYQQKPVPDAGGIIQRNWIHWWPEDQPPPCRSIIASWDTAYGQTQSGDFSACTVWGLFDHDDLEGNRVPCAILLSARRGRWPFGELKRQMVEVAEKFKVDFTLVEAKASGLSAIQELRTLGLPMKQHVPKGQKEDRLHAVAPFFEQGRIFLPKGRMWADDFVEQICNFPSAKYDDYVDSGTQALRTIRMGGGITTTLDMEPQKRTGGVRGYW